MMESPPLRRLDLATIGESRSDRKEAR